jgi:hypothetical protein
VSVQPARGQTPATLSSATIAQIARALQMQGHQGVTANVVLVVAQEMARRGVGVLAA